MELSGISIFIALAAGFLTFFSPCLLPLLPSYFGFLTGRSVNQHISRKTIFIHAWFFVFGFSFIFILLGASVGLIGFALVGKIIWLRRAAGIFLIIFGIHLLGFIKIPLLYRERRLDIAPKTKKGYWASFLVGASFSLSWTACVGPVLGGILGLAYLSQTVFQGALLLAVYSLGLGIPFLICALVFSQISSVLRRMNRFYKLVEIISGLLLIFIGVLLIATGSLTILNRFFS